jgi:alpha-tubulin suppressor-like RCC1 family protein
VSRTRGHPLPWATLLAALEVSVLASCQDAVVDTPGDLATVQVSPAADTLIAVGETRQFSAVAQDAQGNAIGGVSFVWRTQDSAVATVDSTGLATAKASGITNITASVGNKGGRAELTVHQEIAGLAFVGGSDTAVAGDPITRAVRVELKDPGGSRVTHAQVPVTLGANPGGATLAGTLTVTSTAGTATFHDVWLDEVGAGYTLTASAAGLPSDTSAALVVTPGPVELSFLTEPGTAQGQVPFDPAVQVTAAEDRFGNPVPNAAVTIAVKGHPSSEALRGATTVTAVNGVATFGDLSPVLPGDGFVLLATSGRATPAHSAPFSVRLTFVQVSAGGPTCGLTVAGFAYCWGANSYGQLGDGTTDPRLTPAAVQGSLRFTQLTAGGGYACGLAVDSAAYCWGANAMGNLGDGTAIDRLTPVPVQGGLRFAQVSAGALHTCAITPARAAYCWGYGDYGQLGDGTNAPHATPTVVEGALEFAHLATGELHTCGLTTGHEAYCWGELANWSRKSAPTAVSGGLAFVQVNAGTHYACGIASDSAAYCWGSFESEPALVPGGLRFVHVDGGAFHTCGVSWDNVAYCWGENYQGQLGDGTTDNRTDPTPVGGNLAFVQVTASTYHTCGVTTDGAAYCWGDNGAGQLGDGTTTRRLTPTRVVQ